MGSLSPSLGCHLQRYKMWQFKRFLWVGFDKYHVCRGHFWGRPGLSFPLSWLSTATLLSPL